MSAHVHLPDRGHRAARCLHGASGKHIGMTQAPRGDDAQQSSSSPPPPPYIPQVYVRKGDLVLKDECEFDVGAGLGSGSTLATAVQQYAATGTGEMVSDIWVLGQGARWIPKGQRAGLGMPQRGRNKGNHEQLGSCIIPLQCAMTWAWAATGGRPSPRRWRPCWR